MKKYDQLLLSNPLFDKIDAGELDQLLDCLTTSVKTFDKGQMIWNRGDAARRIGIVLAGRVEIIKADLYGNETILTEISPGELFGETFACAGIPIFPVGVRAAAACEIMLMDYRRIILFCSSVCTFHSRLIENMLQIMAQKNLLLNQKIEVLSARTIRDKILVYLRAQAEKRNSMTFEIPFNRQAMADYLSVDRSALSAELSRMSSDGLIRYRKNSFELLES